MGDVMDSTLTHISDLPIPIPIPISIPIHQRGLILMKRDYSYGSILESYYRRRFILTDCLEHHYLAADDLPLVGSGSSIAITLIKRTVTVV